jgi:hypothetical protein
VPVWHASCAWLEDWQPVPVERLTRSTHRLLRSLGEHLLQGVGTGETFVHQRVVAIHVRRRLNDAELAEVRRERPGWLEIPAVDMAG